MTEEQVYRKVLETLTKDTWGQGAWFWQDGAPKCLDGHINHAVFDKSQITSDEYITTPEEMKLLTAIHRRIEKATGDRTTVVYNDHMVHSADQVRTLVFELLKQVTPPEDVRVEVPRSAHRFNLLR